jgi:hypothetical protein
MISDTLSEAVNDIRERYLDVPFYNNTYTGEMRRRIEVVVALMDAVRMELDTSQPQSQYVEWVEFDAVMESWRPWAASCAIKEEHT